MDAEVAVEVGKIAALVARLGREWEFGIYKARIEVCRWDFELSRFSSHYVVNITKTRKSQRIPMLRALADKLRAELKEQKK